MWTQRLTQLGQAMPVVLTAAAVPALMRLPPRWLVPLLGRIPVATNRRPDRIVTARHWVEWYLQRLGRFNRNPCQVRGLTMYCHARAAGEDVSLVFGAGWLDGSFVAHCWLTQDGAPYQERRDPTPVFVEMFRIPRAASQ